MTSNVKKGYGKEKLCRDTLVKEGWTIVFKSVRWRFGTIDFAQLFDVVAVKREGIFPSWLFVSCKHLGNSNYYLPHQEEIKRFKENYTCGDGLMRFEVWLWDKPRYQGRGIKKAWKEGGWVKLPL